MTQNNKIQNNKIQNQVDTLAKDYLSAKEREKSVKETLVVATESIRRLATEIGIKTGKKTLVKGLQFQVGFLETEPTPVLNQERAFKQLPGPILAMCMVQKVDAQVLAALVDAGKVDKELFLSLLDPGTSQKRTVVEFLTSSIFDHESPIVIPKETKRKTAND